MSKRIFFILFTLVLSVGLSSVYAKAKDATPSKKTSPGVSAGKFKPAAQVPVRTTNPALQGMDRKDLVNILVTDWDGDGVIFSADNCPRVANQDQADGDGDGVGDVCDNCLTIANSDQRNGTLPRDAEGDACDDTDGDGILDSIDNCITISNANQVDINNNQVGDICDDDCPLPTIAVSVHNDCSWSSPSADSVVVPDGAGNYHVTWETHNANFVAEDCRGFGGPTGNFVHDSGVFIYGAWNGPLLNQSPPAGFSPFTQLQRIYREFINPVPDAAAELFGPACPPPPPRLGGVFTCTVTAYGACGRTADANFKYCCGPYNQSCDPLP